MLICIFARGRLGSVELEAGPRRGIRDEDISDAAPLVRALLVERLELIWRNCEPHIERTEGRPDPRFVEAGIRVLDRLSRLYRLDHPVAGGDGPDTPLIPTAQLVSKGLEELEARMADAES